jgi:hypothetical protein
MTQQWAWIETVVQRQPTKALRPRPKLNRQKTAHTALQQHKQTSLLQMRQQLLHFLASKLQRRLLPPLVLPLLLPLMLLPLLPRKGASQLQQQAVRRALALLLAASRQQLEARHLQQQQHMWSVFLRVPQGPVAAAAANTGLSQTPCASSLHRASATLATAAGLSMSSLRHTRATMSMVTQQQQQRSAAAWVKTRQHPRLLQSQQKQVQQQQQSQTVQRSTDCCRAPTPGTTLA